ncbi:DJ-1/PfpI family protein [Candidatus Peregrinibacteria bacterium]|nr:MAG: DJ-1/PfpI family protein [Candidatus Peregrinibacteria bacterium]
MATILSFIAPHGFQDIEYADSKAELEAAGHSVITVSTTFECLGKYGTVCAADHLLDEIHFDEYDALLLVGGPGIYDYFHSPKLIALAQQFHSAQKPVSAICAAVAILAQANLLSGKKSTCFEGVADQLLAKGAHYTGSLVEVDDRVVTASGPEAARDFGKAIAQLFTQ